jgi:hypothetical protein
MLLGVATGGATGTLCGAVGFGGYRGRACAAGEVAVPACCSVAGPAASSANVGAGGMAGGTTWNAWLHHRTLERVKVRQVAL